MRAVRGKYYFEDGTLKSDERKWKHQNKSIYEVIRVMEGVPLFFDEHFKRFEYSCYAVNEQLQFSYSDLYSQVKRLVSANEISAGNVLAEQFTSGENFLTRVYFIPHYYPTVEEYSDGVIVGVLHAERKNPEAKVVQSVLREKANKLIQSENLYEVLLVNVDGIITEGSRSNFVYIQNNEVITSIESRVLKGITLLKIKEICQKYGILFVQKDFKLDDVKCADAAFITGTSPKILPIRRLDSFSLNVNNSLMLSVMRWYDQLIEHDIKKGKA